jgi:flagellar basal body-associated protein FliL
MAAKEERKEEVPHEGKPAKGRLLPMVAAVVAIVVLQAGLAVGVVRWLRVSDHAPAKAAVEHGAEGEEEGAGEEEKPSGRKLGCAKTPVSKTVSVSGSQGKRYLKATFCLEYDQKKYQEFEKIAQEQAMRIEAASQKILSSAPMEQVMSPAGQDSISTRLKDEFNALLKHDKVKVNAVLITEWLVQ